MKIESLFIRSIKTVDAPTRLFCFPYAGGGASTYRSWARVLRPGIEVCPVQLPGRENRLSETPFEEIPALLKALFRELEPHLNKPYALFGHSMGALISFELVRFLQRKNTLLPMHLFVSSFRAPHLPARHRIAYDLPRELFVNKLRYYGGSPLAVLNNTELMDLLLPYLRADFRLLDSYVYTSEEPIRIPITAIGGDTDDLVSESELDEWGVHTASGFTRFTISGDHFFIRHSDIALSSLIKRQLNPKDNNAAGDADAPVQDPHRRLVTHLAYPP